MIDAATGLVELDLASLAMLKGGQAVQRLIERVVEDIAKRPADDRKRTVGVKLAFKPKTHVERDEETGRSETILDGVAIYISSNLKMPDQGPVEYDAGVSGGRLVIRPDNPHNHRQPMLPILEGSMG